MEPPVYPTGGIVTVKPYKTELDKQMERWSREPKCTCGRH